MNKQPVSYLQTDPKWSRVSYSAKGESTTIGRAGCGPTAMAMVLATWADKNVTPKTEAAWALAHGYKYPHQGTAYPYFAAAAKRYGLDCKQITPAYIYGNANSPYHAQAKAALDNGDLVIACMGKGLWTSSGHYVLVWKIEGNMVYINDPASTKMARTHGNYLVFKQQVKLYWIIKAPKAKTEPEPKKEEPDMTEKEVKTIIETLTDQEALALVRKALKAMSAQPEPDWSKKEGWWQKAVKADVTDGSAPERPAKRVEVVAMLGRLGLLPGDKNANETAEKLGMD